MALAADGLAHFIYQELHSHYSKNRTGKEKTERGPCINTKLAEEEKRSQQELQAYAAGRSEKTRYIALTLAEKKKKKQEKMNHVFTHTHAQSGLRYCLSKAGGQGWSLGRSGCRRRLRENEVEDRLEGAAERTLSF